MSFKGVVPGLVKSLEDPDGFGRIQVNLPRLPGENRTFWASVAAPMAGGKRGFFFHPELEDEVLVAFDEGDPQHPYIVGFLWNGQDKPPEGASPSVRRLRTVSGHVLEFDDRAGAESIKIKTQGGQEIMMTDTLPEISIKTKGGSEIKITDAPPQIEISATMIKISATALLTIEAPMTNFTGVVNMPTLIAQSVVGSAYTLAPGNLFGL